MSHKKSFFVKLGLGIAAGIFILMAATAFALAPANLKSVVELLATHRFGRPVRIGALHIATGDPFYNQPIAFELDDVHLANAAWGSDPDMLRFARAKGALDPASILHGPLRFGNLALEHADLILERNPQGVGNWKTGSEANDATSHPDNPTDAARSRRHMPGLSNLALRNGHIIFRTSSGALLRIDLDNVALNAPDDDAPINLAVEGAYNNHPVQLSITADSFAALHDADKPFATDVTAKGGDSVVKLKAQLMDPINFDDFHSQLDVTTQNLGSLMALLGDHSRANLPLQLHGYMERHNDQWRLTEVEGKLADSRFQSDMLLMEGARHHPDDVHMTADFDRLNINELRAKMNPQQPPPKDHDFLYADANPDPRLDARLGAKLLVYGPLRATGFKDHIDIAPGSRAMKDIAFAWLGGKVSGSLASTLTADGNTVTADAALAALDAQPLFALAGAGNSMTGKIEARASMTGKGDNFDVLKQQGSGEAVVTIKGGSIAKKQLYRAALDIHALFDKDSDRTPLSCFLAVATVQKGNMLVTPIYMSAKTGSLFGGGTLDLRSNIIDFELQAEKNGALALDLPIHASGSVNAVHIGLGSSADIQRLKAQAPTNINRLSPDFKAQAAKSGCL